MGEMKMEETTTVKKTHPKGSFVCNMTFLLERLAIPLGALLMAFGYLIGWQADNAFMMNLRKHVHRRI